MNKKGFALIRSHTTPWTSTEILASFHSVYTGNCSFSSDEEARGAHNFSVLCDVRPETSCLRLRGGVNVVSLVLMEVGGIVPSDLSCPCPCPSDL